MPRALTKSRRRSWTRPESSDIYTEDELSANFEEHLREHARIMGKSYDAYRADGRSIWLIGLSFDSKTRHLVDYAAERFGGSNR